MLRNHLTTAYRNVTRKQSLSYLHIGGLAIGLTAAIFVIHYARMEFNLDKFHVGNEQIYRVATARIRDGVEMNRFATTFAGAGPAIQSDYPEVESFTRLFSRSRGGIISWTGHDIRFREKDLYNVDSGFFKVFSFPIVKGQPSDLFAPATAFVEESVARKYFGDADPIGQRITFGTVEGLEEYEIRGVVSCPENSSIRFTFLLSYHGLDHFFGNAHHTNWAWLDFHTFVKLHPGADAAKLESQLPAVLKKYRGDRASNSKLLLQKLPDIYLQSSMEFETGRTGDAALVNVLMVLGFLLLIIVALNYGNLSTAQALARAREVAIRKTMGSGKGQLVMQFLTEVGLTNLVAIVLSLLLIWMALPYFNELTGRQLEFSTFLSGELWKYMIGFLVVGTLLIGIWPALHLSSFRPAIVMKGNQAIGQGAIWRRCFVGFQAFVSFSLVVIILVIVDQVNFVKQQDLGINIDNTLVVHAPSVVTDHGTYMSSIESFKKEMLRDNRVTQVTAAADCPGVDVGWISGTRKLGATLNEGFSIYRADIDDAFAPAMGIDFLAGRNFSMNGPRMDVMINESAMQQFNIATLSDAIGQRIIVGSDTLTITGVVKDYHQVSPREPVSPTVYQNSIETPKWVLIKHDGEDPEKVIQSAKAAFTKLFASDFFDYFFLDEFYDRQYQFERRLALVMLVFCALAVVVSSLGLLGLTWFTVSRRRKELAIRKVVGSTEFQLYRHASGNIFLTTLAGCIAGIPVTVLLMNQWLDTFAQHTTVKWWAFGVAMTLALTVALLCVTGFTLRVIRTNPVVHLRHES